MITNLRNHTYDYKTDGSIYNVFSSSHKISLKFDVLDKTDFPSRLSDFLSFYKSYSSGVYKDQTNPKISDEDIVFLSTISDTNTTDINELVFHSYLSTSSKFNIYVVSSLKDKPYALFEKQTRIQKNTIYLFSLFIEKDFFTDADLFNGYFSSIISELAEYDVNKLCEDKGVPINRDGDNNYSTDIILRDTVSVSDIFFTFDYIALIVCDICRAFHYDYDALGKINTDEIIAMIPFDIMLSSKNYEQKLNEYIRDIIDSTVEYFRCEIDTKDYRSDRIEVVSNMYNYIKDSLN